MAYEMARQLHAQGQAVDLLVLMDPDSPAYHRLVRSVVSHFGNLIGLVRISNLIGFYVCNIYIDICDFRTTGA